MLDSQIHTWLLLVYCNNYYSDTGLKLHLDIIGQINQREKKPT